MANVKSSSVLRFLVVLVLGVFIGALIGVNMPDQLVDWKGNGNQSRQLAAQESSETTKYVVMGPSGIADMVEKVSPAVVNIETTVRVDNGYVDPFFDDPFFREFFGDRFGISPRSTYETGIGSGCIISSDGYVLTNQHVVNNAVKIMVTVAGFDQPIPATIVGQDYELDLAVLKLQKKATYTALKMGDSDRIRVGDWVIAIGNPYGLDHTVTAGVISAKGRPVTIGDRQYRNLIQTDAAINPGNSGGPLLSASGELIGINTAVNASAQGIGFAIPINTAKQVLDQLISKGKVERAYMGIGVSEITADTANSLGLSTTKGVLVAQVYSGTPAEKAGLHTGDVITAIDGKTVNNYDGLKTILDTKKAGQTITVKVIRNGSTKELPLTLAAKP
ncbi:MAG: trypsin-like peptidase domain-containing protein [Syntrophothermus sp.]|uniref:trypsin-like peptidase domain-containing protein n=1 Tax=Syntrophothermus sp. TaxID=2736299 RepID=UPI00257E7F78|nr:trypsin-like peptidase domain-containing protein [Syntrophothermus sp.]NSW83015.1 trypsin-like peptidase domain-containing protein [Syntrophothermus sp.]